MKKSMYFLIMAIGASSILAGLLSLFRGADFNAYFYAIFIGIVLMGTTYYNQQQKNKK